MKKEQTMKGASNINDEFSQNENLNELMKNLSDENIKLPTFPDSLFPQLPQFLQDAVSMALSDQDRDMLLLGTLTTISSCLPNIYGIYASQKVYSNLFLYVIAPAAAGKGNLNFCKKIISPIHKQKKDGAKSSMIDFSNKLAEFNKNKSSDTALVKPLSPKQKLLIIPANNSSTGVFQLLDDNEGRGLIFETEGDTMTQALKTDYGNYSDGFRKAFHHETISYFRRTGREFVEIESPCLSVLLSGTPGQVYSLIPDAENGLFSRFLFYYLDLNMVWNDVFAHSSSNSLDIHFKDLGNKFLAFYNLLEVNNEIKIKLSDTQSKLFFEYFEKTQSKFLTINPDQYASTVRRLGLIFYRFTMLFTALRIMEEDNISNLTKERMVSDVDFNNALEMVKVLIKHSRKLFSTFANESNPKGFRTLKERFLDSLPKHFSRQDYLVNATNLGIHNKAAERHIAEFVKAGLLNKNAHNSYINTLVKDIEETKDIEEVGEVGGL